MEAKQQESGREERERDKRLPSRDYGSSSRLVLCTTFQKNAIKYKSVKIIFTDYINTAH